MANGNSVLPLFEASPFLCDGDAFLQSRIARAGDRRAMVVRSVSGNVDDPPQP